MWSTPVCWCAREKVVVHRVHPSLINDHSPVLVAGRQTGGVIDRSCMLAKTEGPLNLPQLFRPNLPSSQIFFLPSYFPNPPALLPSKGRGRAFQFGLSPQKNAILTLEANISGLKAHLGESRTSFENCMFSAFNWAQKQVNSIPASMRKSGFKKLT